SPAGPPTGASRSSSCACRAPPASHPPPPSAADPPHGAHMKKKLLIFGLPLLVLLAAGFAAKTFVLGGSADEAALAKEPGPVYAMDEAFVVNLADRGDVPHFAKVGVALRFSQLSAGEITPAAGDTPASVEDDAQL